MIFASPIPQNLSWPLPKTKRVIIRVNRQVQYANLIERGIESFIILLCLIRNSSSFTNSSCNFPYDINLVVVIY
jgi:hypothetical protein